MDYPMSLLGAISSKPFEVIREELMSWEPWKVVLPIVLILIVVVLMNRSYK